MIKTKHQEILNIIAAIRDSHSEMESIFSNGSCLNFFAILRSIYPDAKCYFNIDHIITKIDERFYDITGCVSGKGYEPFTNVCNKKRNTKSFKYMMKAEYEL